MWLPYGSYYTYIATVARAPPTCHAHAMVPPGHTYVVLHLWQRLPLGSFGGHAFMPRVAGALAPLHLPFFTFLYPAGLTYGRHAPPRHRTASCHLPSGFAACTFLHAVRAGGWTPPFGVDHPAHTPASPRLAGPSLSPHSPHPPPHCAHPHFFPDCTPLCPTGTV